MKLKPNETGLYLIQIYFVYSIILCWFSRNIPHEKWLLFILLCVVPGILTVVTVEYIIPAISYPEKDKWKWEKDDEDEK